LNNFHKDEEKFKETNEKLYQSRFKNKNLLLAITFLQFDDTVDSITAFEHFQGTITIMMQLTEFTGIIHF
jgi:hypothetical protein